MNLEVQKPQILPLFNEKPSSYAERLGVFYSSLVTKEHKKNYGQYFTPLEIAEFMASFSKVDKENVKILDPGCGIGILSISLIEKLVTKTKKVKNIDLVAFETDIHLLPFAERCFDYLRVWMNAKGIDFKILLCKNDFILHNSLVLNSVDCTLQEYDIVISNPPYFKLPKHDERAIAAKPVIFGQSNIYIIFLLISAKVLKSDGELIFITPRSFCSGNYFRVFREMFFSLVDLKEIHLFNSRASAFKKDKVLQENIIFKANKISTNDFNKSIYGSGDLSISSSNGLSDINERSIKKYKLANLINITSYQKNLHLPINEIDEKIINFFKSWSGSLKKYNLEISTGPIVDFRNYELIDFKQKKNTVPLIRLHNVESMKFIWPNNFGLKGKLKGQYIINNEKSHTRLVKNRNYVLIRRFSTKDDKRRLIAAPYFKSYNSNLLMIGIENHLNYVYHKNGELTIDQSIGLAALLNSRLFDLYFRTFNGNINVSATELRDFPLPNFDLIQLLGLKIRKTIKNKSSYDIDTLVSEIFNLSHEISTEICTER